MPVSQQGNLQSALLSAKGDTYIIQQEGAGSIADRVRESALKAQSLNAKGAASEPILLFANTSKPAEPSEKKIRRGKKVNAPAPVPQAVREGTVSVSYKMELSNGAMIGMSEVALGITMIDNEAVTVMYPYDQHGWGPAKTRMRPEKGAQLEIEVDGEYRKCFSPGLHFDFQQLGLSISTYLVYPS